MGIMDGLTGLEKVFEEEFSRMQRSNAVRSTLPEMSSQGATSLNQQVADDLRSIFYASSRKKAEEFAISFRDKKWEKDLPQR
jgi:superfamily II DNA helicase RecQ